jgi:hypothetical protein
MAATLIAASFPYLSKNKTLETTGTITATGAAAGEPITIQTANKKKVWYGSTVSKLGSDPSGNPIWDVHVKCSKYETSTGYETETVTVTVTPPPPLPPSNSITITPEIVP